MITLRRFVLPALLAVATLWAHPASASTLNLLRVRWTPGSTVKYFIKANDATSPSIVDVKAAADSWNDVLPSSAPNLEQTFNESAAQIVIHLKRGGGTILGQTSFKTTNVFSCSLQSVSIQLSGKVFGQNFNSFATRNVARHELGHALGLGHINKSTDLMYATADSAFFNTDVYPSSCDVQGVSYIYSLGNCSQIQSSITVNCP